MSRLRAYVQAHHRYLRNTADVWAVIDAVLALIAVFGGGSALVCWYFVCGMLTALALDLLLRWTARREGWS